jgi:hypothetical protein
MIRLVAAFSGAGRVALLGEFDGAVRCVVGAFVAGATALGRIRKNTPIIINATTPSAAPI